MTESKLMTVHAVPQEITAMVRSIGEPMVFPEPQALLISNAQPRVSAVSSQFEATGFAQVLVQLKDEVLVGDLSAANVKAGARKASTRRRTVAASETSSSTALGRTLANIEQYFSVPPEAQDTALARSELMASAHLGRKASRAGTAKKRSARPVASMSVAPETSAESVIPKVRVYPNLGLMLGTVTPENLEALRVDPRVENVQGAPALSLIRPKGVVAATTNSSTSWGVERLGAPELWKAGFTGKGVLVGHLDTGVDATHVALKGAVKFFAEFDDVGRLVPGATPRDSDEHGTHTAGTIVGRAVGTTQFGVAPEAMLASAMVIEGGNVVARIVAGMDWVVGQGVKILSMSLGLRGYTPAFLMIVQALRKRGVLPVIAVGNEGPGTSRSPGNYTESLSVGASDESDSVASFSGSQRFQRPGDPFVPDIVGPGVDVLSCVPGGGYAEMSGTSMATPHIAGLAALLMQVSGATAQNVEKAILDSAQLAPRMLPDRAGKGIPNGVRAFELLTGVSLASIAPPKSPPVRKPRKPSVVRPKPKAVKKKSAAKRRKA